MKLSTIILPFIFVFVIDESYSQNYTQASCQWDIVVPGCPNNTLQKQGYNVLLYQIFINPDLYWNKSGRYDDTDSCLKFFMRNPANVTYPCSAVGNLDDSSSNTDQAINPSQYKCYANIWNTNVSYKPGCDFSMGEMKSFSTQDSTFKSYYFYGSGYFEAKVKLFARQGQGSSMWLWSVSDADDPTISHPDILDNNEIDVFETRENSTDLFDITYHWRKIPGLDVVEKSHTIRLIDYDYSASWTVFAVEWNEQRIRWFVNNEMVDEFYMSESPGTCTIGNPAHFYPPIGPFALRFWSGPNFVGPHNPPEAWTMPVNMQIEYVRVYKKVGEKAAPIKIFAGIKNQICIAENSFGSSKTVLTANYYPDANYTWSSPAFEIEPYEIPGHWPQHHNGKVKVWVKPGIQGNQTYPIYLTTTMPYLTEQDTIYYFIAAPNPLPPNSFEATKVLSSACLFEINNPIYNSSTFECEFYNDENQLWQEATIRIKNGQRYAFFGHYDPYTFVPISYREKNSCGNSEIRYSSLTTPSVQPGECGW